MIKWGETEFSKEEVTQAIQASPALARTARILKENPQSDDPRLFRHQHWCEAAANTILQKKHPREICMAWSLATEGLLQKTWRDYGLDQEDLALCALGKLGARELNLSSDIDLVVISGKPCDAALETRVRKWVQLLSSKTDFGFCFRVDFDLRPGGRFAPLIPSISRAEDHYWSAGATWERLALVRARILAGPEAVTQQIQDLFARFSFRKYIDYTLLNDLKHLRSDIFQHRPPMENGAFHLKLSPGGIRDIELFIHALQVIHGGREPTLREKSTEPAVHALKKNGVADAAELDFLLEFYWELRQLENYVQAREDRQTHVYNGDALVKIETQAVRVDKIVSDVVGRAEQSEGLPADASAQENWLHGLGYSDDTIRLVWPNILQATAQSQRRSQDESARQKVLRRFMEFNGQSVDPDLGARYLADFMKSTRAKASFFSLLLHEPKLLKDLANILGSSPFLSQMLVSRPELLDSILLQKTGEVPDDWAEMLEHLLERRLLAELFSSIDFLRTLNVADLSRILTATADEITEAVLQRLKKDHDAPDLEILKLGKWASGEVGLHSDLDFVLVTEDKPSEAAHKVAKRLISRLTEAHKGGSLYAVDLRLRPSGSAGPLLLRKQDLRDYLEHQAQPWERQSYYRSEMQTAALTRSFSTDDLIALRDIREKLHNTKPDDLDLKFRPGGLVDLEFGAQIALVKHGVPCKALNTVNLFKALSGVDPAWTKHEALLGKNYLYLRAVEQTHRLVTQSATATFRKDSPTTRRLAKIFNMPVAPFIEDLEYRFQKNSALLKTLDPVWAPH